MKVFNINLALNGIPFVNQSMIPNKSEVLLQSIFGFKKQDSEIYFFVCRNAFNVRF